MNKQQLASKIWESANKMRSTIEASQYKDYILGFIFYKFLSETEVANLQKNDFPHEDLPTLVESDADLVDWVKGECGYFIGYENLFSTWLAMGKDFGIDNVHQALSAFDRNISPAHKKLFDGIFDTLQTGLSKLGSDARSQSKAVRDLIYLIKDIPMDGRQGYDVLGFIYEYLIGQFASNAGKKAGEFYTPHEVSELMSEIVAWHLRKRSNITIYDPTSGSGSLLITIGKAVARRNGNPDAIKYYAQELKENTFNLTRMNLVMRGILPDNIVVRNGDTLEDDWPWFDTVENKEETYDPLFVDAVVSNPPYSQAWDPEGKDVDARFSYGIAPKSKADYAFLLHDLYHLRPDGIMAIVLPHGVLFRGGEEGAIRKNLVEHHHIQAIIGLPANIFFGTGIPTIVMVLRKQRAEGDVLIVDASKHFVKEGKSNKLRASDIKRIVDAVMANADVDGFSRLVGIEEIRANDYNLNIPRYVDSSEAAETWDVYASMFGGVPESELEALSKYWDAWPGLREQLFAEDGTPCARCKVEDVAAAIRKSEQVTAFKQHFADCVSGLAPFMRHLLLDSVETVDSLAGESEASVAIEEMIDSVALIDRYAAYQELDDAWANISVDLEIIQTEGLSSVRAVDPNMVLKKKSGKDAEVQDGWTGRILPFELVQNKLLSDDVAAIAQLEERLANAESELTEIIDEASEEDKQACDAFNEAGDGLVAAALKREAKRIGKAPESEFEQNLVRAQALLDEQKKLKATCKVAKAELEDKTKEAIESLSDEQCEMLLEAKWIAPLQKGLEALPDAAVEDFASRVAALCAKYETTYADICREIKESECELAAMLDDLTGDEFDMAGIAELKSLLGGE